MENVSFISFSDEVKVKLTKFFAFMLSPEEIADVIDNDNFRQFVLDDYNMGITVDECLLGIVQENTEWRYRNRRPMEKMSLMTSFGEVDAPAMSMSWETKMKSGLNMAIKFGDMLIMESM